jgi:multicomponent Na+:H+ antiporter subunit C
MIGKIPYFISIAIMLVGVYGIAINKNYLKKLMSLGIFQAGAIIFFIALAKVSGGSAPIMECVEIEKCSKIVANPLPHVLMLTAIVVGVATLSVGLALIIRIREEYGKIEEDEGSK